MKEMRRLHAAVAELASIVDDETLRKEGLRTVRNIAQDMMDDLPDITLQQARDASNRFAARFRKRLGIKDTNTMKEMDQDGCLVEADTHEASQPVPKTECYNCIQTSATINPAVFPHKRYCADCLAGNYEQAHEASQYWQHANEEVNLPVSAFRGGFIEQWSFSTGPLQPIGVGGTVREVTVSLQAVAEDTDGIIKPLDELADTPVVTEVRE